MDRTELPLTEADCADLALVLRTPDPLDDHPEVQQRWLALMRKYPGKNALDMAADFLEHLTSAKDCCYNTHADDCPNGHGAEQSEDETCDLVADGSRCGLRQSEHTDSMHPFTICRPRHTSQAFDGSQLCECGDTYAAHGICGACGKCSGFKPIVDK